MSQHTGLKAILRQNLADQEKTYRDAQSVIDLVRADLLASGKRSPSDADSAKVALAKEALAKSKVEIDALNERIAELEADEASDAAARHAAHLDNPERGKQVSTVHVGADREAAGMYRKELDLSGERSFFKDMFDAEIQHDLSARQRLDKFTAEHERAQSTGLANGLVVPNYLVDQIALVVRAGRPAANSVQHQEIPEGGMSMIIPKGVVGSTAASQVTENSAVSNTDMTWNSGINVPVVTIAGQQDVSRQLLERGVGIDQIISQDLGLAYAAEVDRQVLEGSGASNQMLGIRNTSGIGITTAFTAAVTATTFWLKVAQAVSLIAANRMLPPDTIVMHPRRLSWLLAQVDTQGRPLVVPQTVAVNPEATGDYTQVYNPQGATQMLFQGLRIVADANVPTNIGTGPEDVMYVFRSQDLILWERGDGMPTSLRYDQTLAGQLTSKIVAYGYASFTAARYPTAVAIVGGNSAAGFGLVTPAW